MIYIACLKLCEHMRHSEQYQSVRLGKEMPDLLQNFVQSNFNETN